MKVSDVGEAGLLERIRQRVPTLGADESGPGDDTAVLGAYRGSKTLVTTDLLVEGLDFDLGYTSGSDLGWKSLAVNVSDVCAMAGVAHDAVVAVGLRGDLDLGFFDALLDGLLEAAARFNVRLVGGDISGSDEVIISATVLGSCDRPVTRTGAHPGDFICVTGALGGSAGALRSLQQGDEVDPDLLARHLRPMPRILEGPVLGEAGATAMIDISDGFGIDLKRVMEASGTGCNVDPDAMPVDPGLAPYEDAAALALGGGEDFELLVTLPPERFETATRAVLAAGGVLTKVGEVTQGEMMVGDRPLEGSWLGWEHLRNR